MTDPYKSKKVCPKTFRIGCIKDCFMTKPSCCIIIKDHWHHKTSNNACNGCRTCCSFPEKSKNEYGKYARDTLIIPCVQELGNGKDLIFHVNGYKPNRDDDQGNSGNPLISSNCQTYYKPVSALSDKLFCSDIGCY